MFHEPSVVTVVEYFTDGTDQDDDDEIQRVLRISVEQERDRQVCITIYQMEIWVEPSLKLYRFAVTLLTILEVSR